MHCPGPRLADREGAIITRPEGPPHTRAFHPGQRPSGPQTLITASRPVISQGRGRTRRPEARPGGKAEGAPRERGGPALVSTATPAGGAPRPGGVGPRWEKWSWRRAPPPRRPPAEGRFVDAPTGTSRPNPRPAGQAASTARPGRE